MRNIALFIAFQLMLSTSLFSQHNKSQQLSNFIKKTMTATPNIPGVAVAVADANGTLFTGGYGFADVENQLPATADTDFYIASTTKCFNGLLATILDNEGKIDLDGQVTDYKPFSNFENKEIFQGITIMDLLSHQSGMNNKYLSIKLAYSGDFTDKEILQLIESDSHPNKEGKIFDYTNYGYYLLDVLLKAELNKSWKDLLEEKIFTPLGMENTTAYISEVQKNNLALPYLTIFPDKVNQGYLMKNDKTMHAAGGLVTSANDIAKFITFYTSMGKAGENQLYPEALIAQTYAKQTDAEHKLAKIFKAHGYATGWRLGTFKDQEVVYHFGGYSGFFSHLSFLPEQQLGVAVFVNHDMGMPLADLIAEYAYNLFMDKEADLKKLEASAADKLGDMLIKHQKRAQEHQEKMAKRTWQLTLPKSAYAGTYRNDKIGKVEVVFKNDDLFIKTGRLQATGTPFPRPDCVRIELIPGSGMVVQFQPKDGAVNTFKLSGDIFEKI